MAPRTVTRYGALIRRLDTATDTGFCKVIRYRLGNVYHTVYNPTIFNPILIMPLKEPFLETAWVLFAFAASKSREEMRRM